MQAFTEFFISGHVEVIYLSSLDNSNSNVSPCVVVIKSVCKRKMELVFLNVFGSVQCTAVIYIPVSRRY